jgi:hypothetical protein
LDLAKHLAKDVSIGFGGLEDEVVAMEKDTGLFAEGKSAVACGFGEDGAKRQKVVESPGEDPHIGAGQDLKSREGRLIGLPCGGKDIRDECQLGGGGRLAIHVDEDAGECARGGGLDEAVVEILLREKVGDLCDEWSHG